MAQKGNKAAFKKINVEDLIINDLTEENIHQYTESEDVRNELCDKLQSDFLKHSADMADLQKRSEHLVEMMRIVSEKHTQVKTIECNNVLSKKVVNAKKKKESSSSSHDEINGGNDETNGDGDGDGEEVEKTDELETDASVKKVTGRGTKKVAGTATKKPAVKRPSTPKIPKAAGIKKTPAKKAAAAPNDT